MRKGGRQGRFRSKPSGERGCLSSAARGHCCPLAHRPCCSSSDIGHSCVSVGPTLVLCNFQGHVCCPFPRDSYSQAPAETSLFRMKLQLSFPYPSYTLCLLSPGDLKNRSMILSAGVTGRGLRGHSTQFHMNAWKRAEVQCHSGGGG